MRRVCTAIAAIAWSGLFGSGVAVGDTVVECSGLDSPEGRETCVSSWIARGRPTEDTLGELDELIAVAPAVVLEILESTDSTHGPAPEPALRAATLDRCAAALTALSRHREAVEALRAGLELDDGIPRLEWVRSDGTIAWSVGLTAGDGREERLARSLVASGEAVEARSPLARALALGAGETAWELWTEIGEGDVPGLDTAPSSLLGQLWFPPVPDIEVELIDGGRRRLRDFDGKALLLAFWAVWCEPCAEELPSLQALQDAERENGLDILTVNMNDPDDAAQQFAWALDLRMPIARYSTPIEDAFHVRALPTVIVLDRNGRLRKRWSGRRTGAEHKIAEVVRTLLDDATPQPEEQVAEVLSGRGRLDVRWTRRLPAAVEGLAPLPGDAEAGPRLAVGAGRELVVFGPEGLVTERRPAAAGSGQLRSADREIDAGRYALIGFRRGATRVVRLAPDGEAGVRWETPAPLLDVAFEPVREATPPALWLATTTGLHRVGVDGKGLGAREDLGVLRAVAVTRSGLGAVLDSAGRLTWLDGALETVRTQDTSSSSSVLVSARGLADGVGVAPSTVTSASVGRFLNEDAVQVALAAAGQLVLLDLASGAERFRARWPELGILAAGDLDGDGRDELIVGSGRRLTMLVAGKRPTARSQASR